MQSVTTAQEGSRSDAISNYDLAIFVRHRHLSDNEIIAFGQMSLIWTFVHIGDICSNRVSFRFHKLGVALPL